MRVWFDSLSRSIVIDGIAPMPAQSLVASWDGNSLWAREPTGRGVFALAFRDVQDKDGMAFTSPSDALAYLDSVFSMTFNIDAGVV